MQCTGKSGHGRAKLTGGCPFLAGICHPRSPGTDCILHTCSVPCGGLWERAVLAAVEGSWSLPWDGQDSISPLCRVQHPRASPKAAAPLSPTHGGRLAAG